MFSASNLYSLKFTGKPDKIIHCITFRNLFISSLLSKTVEIDNANVFFVLLLVVINMNRDIIKLIYF